MTKRFMFWSLVAAVLLGLLIGRSFQYYVTGVFL